MNKKDCINKLFITVGRIKYYLLIFVIKEAQFCADFMNTQFRYTPISKALLEAFQKRKNMKNVNVFIPFTWILKHNLSHIIGQQNPFCQF